MVQIRITRATLVFGLLFCVWLPSLSATAQTGKERMLQRAVDDFQKAELLEDTMKMLEIASDVLMRAPDEPVGLAIYGAALTYLQDDVLAHQVFALEGTPKDHPLVVDGKEQLGSRLMTVNLEFVGAVLSPEAIERVSGELRRLQSALVPIGSAEVAEFKAELAELVSVPAYRFDITQDGDTTRYTDIQLPKSDGSITVTLSDLGLSDVTFGIPSSSAGQVLQISLRGLSEPVGMVPPSSRSAVPAVIPSASMPAVIGPTSIPLSLAERNSLRNTGWGLIGTGLALAAGAGVAGFYTYNSGVRLSEARARQRGATTYELLTAAKARTAEVRQENTIWLVSAISAGATAAALITAGAVLAARAHRGTTDAARRTHDVLEKLPSIAVSADQVHLHWSARF
ncbi:MAG: hypothetical protein VX223_10720 [Myxococcota bacterium]|nr:hypothetical protein [Myxococcota bacterium]